MTDRQPMQADGGGKPGKPPSGDGTAPKKRGDGESAGGPYPGAPRSKAQGTFDGGQSERAYSGPDNPNATTD